MHNTQIQRHPFHLVSVSPWPMMIAISLCIMAFGGALYMHRYIIGGTVLGIGFVSTALISGLWWRDVIREGSFEGAHSVEVVNGLKIGFILFVVSEVLFFFAFFWAFFHSALAPAIEIGSVWPPKGIEVFNPFEIPLLNTIILLTSGFTLTYAHHGLISRDFQAVKIGMTMTLIYAVLFTACQGYEYYHSGFTIADGIYGSCFYMATGFHGVHVLVGTTFLTIMYYRILEHHFSSSHAVGYDTAIWYWHFVDVVWLFLYVVVYYSFS